MYLADFGSKEKWNFWIIQSLRAKIGMGTNFGLLIQKRNITLQFEVIMTSWWRFLNLKPSRW